MSLSVESYRAKLLTSSQKAHDLLPDCLREAEGVMSPAGLEAWLDACTRIGGLGRGVDLILIALEELPEVVRLTDERLLPRIAEMTEILSAKAIGAAIGPFLSGLPTVARRLGSGALMNAWFDLVLRVAEEGREGLVALLEHVNYLFSQVSIGGVVNWADYGLKAYKTQPHRFPDFFGFQTADALAVLQRERHGVLFIDTERRIRLWLKAMWSFDSEFRAFSLLLNTHELRKPVPHIDKLGLHIPDVFDDVTGFDGQPVSGLDRYRAMVAHMAAHRQWSEPYLADNFSPFQHLAIETFEDSRVEALAFARHPGLRRMWRAQHPIPKEGAVPEGHAPFRHMLAMLSRAILDPQHGYQDPVVTKYAALFRREFETNPHDPKLSVRLGVEWLAENYSHDFRQKNIWFQDTLIPYRDDNRYLWVFLEDTDSEDEFHSDHGTKDPEAGEAEDGIMPPRHYPEWDYATQTFRPDWTTVFERFPPSGDPAVVDRMLDRHRLLVKKLKWVIDQLKPHDRKRLRFQSEGDELDLDALIRAMTDYRAGSEPDNRIYVRHVPGGRDIAVMLLLDLSESVKQTPEGMDCSILQLGQEAAALLAWTVDQLGDKLAMAGFSSHTRHEVHFTHFKTFKEPWGEVAKGRLAAMEAGYSTRMGAALRHAGDYLAPRYEAKKILFVLSDGEPADIDVEDRDYLVADTHKAVSELKQKGVVTYGINLDPHADDYVEEIFGRGRYALVDRLDRLPEKLSQMFMALTR